MRHHEPLITMRLRGSRPSDIHLETACWVPNWEFWPEWHPEQAYVHIEPEDHVERLDLRFLVGCNVHINGEDARLTRALFEVARDHGASRVIASCAHPVGDTFQHDFILDTQGELTWPM